MLTYGFVSITLAMPNAMLQTKANHQAPISPHKTSPIIVGITPHHKRGSGAKWG
ncbi:hypothetical protein [Helicobacter zhangjianzhongii]|uniref:Uncharacterized protein n=1 Tax=Helicobacter zhangjianzhongii TaxID=2974574 RepID=A0ACC6FQN4_9HELI|nr:MULTISPECIES: hypothetical protein [unclassified Helicobacter]MDL0079608.1 hypothetical protein [Helicobacter sp. CPD2-1]MDL0081493.1 hypothetical protein [Helicobacter sp. XJK30-2]